MSATPASSRVAPSTRLARALDILARGFALGGGAVLLAVMAVTVASVIGRSLFGRPIPGDFELVEIGCAVAVFAFLPYCQITRGNVVVDLFTRGFGRRPRAWLDRLHALVLAAIGALFAWRLALGGVELRSAGETSMILGVPLWWGFAPIVASSALLAAVALHMAFSGDGRTRP